MPSRSETLAIAFSTSLASWTEPGNAGLHNCIKPDPRLDSFGDLPHGAFRNGRDLKVLLDAAGSLRGGQESRDGGNDLLSAHNGTRVAPSAASLLADPVGGLGRGGTDLYVIAGSC
jgi:hypothetical protein